MGLKQISKPGKYTGSHRLKAFPEWDAVKIALAGYFAQGRMHTWLWADRQSVRRCSQSGIMHCSCTVHAFEILSVQLDVRTCG